MARQFYFPGDFSFFYERSWKEEKIAGFLFYTPMNSLYGTLSFAKEMTWRKKKNKANIKPFSVYSLSYKVLK
jgi:hypothetical protein